MFIWVQCVEQTFRNAVQYMQHDLILISDTTPATEYNPTAPPHLCFFLGGLQETNQMRNWLIKYCSLKIIKPLHDNHFWYCSTKEGYSELFQLWCAANVIYNQTLASGSLPLESIPQWSPVQFNDICGFECYNCIRLIPPEILYRVQVRSLSQSL